MNYKNIFLGLFLSVFLGLKAQDNSLSVKIHPAKSFPWTVLYELKDVKQIYVDNKQLAQDSVFVFDLQKLHPGMYMLMYDMNPKNFVYFIYNNEPVSLRLYPFKNNKIEVLQSEENRVFLPFLQTYKALYVKMQTIEKKIFNQKFTPADQMDYIALRKSLDSLHQRPKSSKLLASKYIRHMRNYFPNTLTNASSYIKEKDLHFFDYLDFNDTDLQHSNIIIDKINDYVFNFNPPQDSKTKHLEYLRRIERILPRINDTVYRHNVIFSLTSSFVNVDGRVSKLLIDKYIKKMSEKEQSQININNILDEIGLTIGEKAPDFSFTDLRDKKHSLYQITSQQPYTLLIFWSATCPHCLHAMPKIQKMMKSRPDFKVVAIGLESEKYPWSSEHQYYPEFVHGLKLQKWDNPIVKTYHLKATPTFFILNDKNEIIAEPYVVENLETFLKNHPAKPAK